MDEAEENEVLVARKNQNTRNKANVLNIFLKPSEA